MTTHEREEAVDARQNAREWHFCLTVRADTEEQAWEAIKGVYQGEADWNALIEVQGDEDEEVVERCRDCERVTRILDEPVDTDAADGEDGYCGSCADRRYNDETEELD